MTYSGKLCSHYHALGLAPIDPENFAGQDMRFSAEFEAIETELAKGASIHAAGRTDWVLVRQLCEAILGSGSKDLRVVVRLVWALHQLESFPGLLAGLGMLRHLCQAHWPELYPVRAGTRLGAFAWLLPRLEQVLNEDVPLKGQLPLFRAMAEHLEVLDQTLSAHLEGDAPLILPLRRRLASWVERVDAGASQSGAVAHVRQKALQMLTSGSLIANEKDAHKALRAIQDAARPLTAWWMRQKATEVRALRLNRTLAWLPINALPESNADRVTDLRGLARQKQSSYQQRLEAGCYADLLLDLEVSLARTPFWFDGHRLVWECLQALQAEAAAREVELHFALILHRFPGIDRLSFQDGQPFANHATRDWITTRVMPCLEALAAAQAPEACAEPESIPPWEAAFEAARSVLCSEGLKSAVQMLKHDMASATGGRERFFWQFNLARLCFQAKQFELARTRLEVLDKQLHEAGLNEWEPELVLQVLHLLHKCCESLPQNHQVRGCKDEVYRRLSHLDLEMVLEQAHGPH